LPEQQGWIAVLRFIALNVDAGCHPWMFALQRAQLCNIANHLRHQGMPCIRAANQPGSAIAATISANVSKANAGPGKRWTPSKRRSNPLHCPSFGALLKDINCFPQLTAVRPKKQPP